MQITQRADAAFAAATRVRTLTDGFRRGVQPMDKVRKEALRLRDEAELLLKETQYA